MLRCCKLITVMYASKRAATFLRRCPQILLYGYYTVYYPLYYTVINSLSNNRFFCCQLFRVCLWICQQRFFLFARRDGCIKMGYAIGVFCIFWGQFIFSKYKLQKAKFLGVQKHQDVGNFMMWFQDKKFPTRRRSDRSSPFFLESQTKISVYCI